MIARDCGKLAEMSKEEAERWRLIWVKAPLASAATTNKVAAPLVDRRQEAKSWQF